MASGMTVTLQFASYAEMQTLARILEWWAARGGTLNEQLNRRAWQSKLLTGQDLGYGKLG